MLALILALQSMPGMDMPPAPKAKGKPTADMVEVHLEHHNQIAVSELAKSTIAYCQRTKQTRCENEVSAISGGAKVVVCKVGKTWLVNKCAKRRK